MIVQTGPISLLNVLAELRIANPGRQLPISLNDPDVRALAGVPSGPISLANFYGKSSAAPVASWNADFSNASGTKAIKSATLSINGDGSVTHSSSGTNSNWYSPDVAGIGANYWVKFTNGGGAGNWSGATLGTLYNLTSGGRSITVTSVSTTSDDSGTLTISIYKDAGGTELVSTGHATYEVGWTGL
jgi:hypothetical protein